MNLKPKYILMAFACLFLISSIYLAQAGVTIISPSGGEYDAEKIDLKARLTGDDNYTLPIQVKFSDNPAISHDMYRFSSYYIYELNFFQFENNTNLSIAVEAYNEDDERWESAVISVKVLHLGDPTPTATTTPEPKKLMKITGISDNYKITSNETIMVIVNDNDTGLPVDGINIIISEDGITLSNAFVTTISGRAKIDWLNYNDETLPNDIYFLRFEHPDYETIEWNVRLSISTPEDDKPELSIWGLDRKYNTDMPASDIIKVKDSETDKYISEVVIRVITGSGIPVTGNMITNEYGTVDFSTTGIQPGSYSVVFEHPDYETKIQDITISYVPTPTPTPTPTPIPTFTAYGTVFKVPYNFGGVTYTTAEQYINEWNSDGTKKAVIIPIQTPNVQVTNNTPPNAGIVQGPPKLEIGWIIVIFGIVSIVAVAAFKNHSKLNPESKRINGMAGTVKEMWNTLRKPNMTTAEHIPVHQDTPDLDIEGSIMESESLEPTTELLQDMQDIIDSPEVLEQTDTEEGQNSGDENGK